MTMAMTDAVIKRPQRELTLIEKLEQEVKNLGELKAKEKPDSLEYIFLGHHIVATVNAINIVKQHQAESGWVSVDERLPVLEVERDFRKFDPANFYQVIDHENVLHNAYYSTDTYHKDDRGVFTLCSIEFYNSKWIVDDEYEVFPIHMVKSWQPLPQPPSEVSNATDN